jgi:hypothetical protein
MIVRDPSDGLLSATYGHFAPRSFSAIQAVLRRRFRDEQLLGRPAAEWTIPDRVFKLGFSAALHWRLCDQQLERAVLDKEMPPGRKRQRGCKVLAAGRE